MRKHKRPFTLFLIALLALLLLIFLIYSFPPSSTIAVGILGIPVLIPFFVLLFIFIFGSTGFITISKLQGIIAAAFLLGYSFLRFFHFTHFFFTFLLVVLFFVTELFVIKSK